MLSSSSASIHDELKILFSSRSKLHLGVNNFLAGKRTDIEFYADRFRELLDLLDPDNRNLDGADRSSLHGKHLRPHEEYVYPDDVRENLIAVLEEHAMCISSMHESKAPVGTASRHPTRLCLSTGGRNVRQLVQFDLVMASMDFECWQEISLSVAL